MTTAPLRVGLIGAGGIAHPHAAAWRHLGAGLSVTSIVGAEALAAAYGATVVPDVDALLAGVDIVDIVTPTATHAELVHRAIDAGVDVVCEKPLARTGEQAWELADRATSAGVLLYPAHVARFIPEYVSAHRAVRAGRIGRPAVARFRRQGPAPASDWFFDEAVSGGIVMDQMIHDLDMAHWLLGPVVRVFARQRVDTAGGRIRSAHVVLTHADGAISLAHGVWGAEVLAGSSSFAVSGTTGSIAYDTRRDDTSRTDLPTGTSGGAPLTTDVRDSPYTAELAHMLDVCAGRVQPRITAAEGAAAVAIAEAATQSIATGSAVDVPSGSDLQE